MKTFSVTPRVKWSHGLGQLSSSTVFGFDYYHGKVTADYHGSFGNQDATQTSQALYAQNNTELAQNLNLNLGLRRQHVNQEANQAEYVPFFYPAITGNATHDQNAYDLGITYHEPSWGIFAKTGRSFRFANTDELFGFDPITFQPTFFGNIIKPQTAQNYEVGINFQHDALSGKAALYKANVSDEIGFDSTQQINANLDPTRHQGIEAELSWEMLTDLKAKVSYAYNNAEFKNGLNKGNALPSVPKNSAHAQLHWNALSLGKYVAQLNYVGERRTVGDFANTLNKLPSYTTLDLRANWELKQFTISLNALNVTDKKYSQSAIFSSFRNDYFYYPSNGRTFYLSASYDFK
jgi:iron complex outermembrane receptor protein